MEGPLESYVCTNCNATSYNISVDQMKMEQQPQNEKVLFNFTHDHQNYTSTSPTVEPSSVYLVHKKTWAENETSFKVSMTFLSE